MAEPVAPGVTFGRNSLRKMDNYLDANSCLGSRRENVLLMPVLCLKCLKEMGKT